MLGRTWATLLRGNNSIVQQHTRSVMSKTALVILANGAEEMEFVIAADTLRRAGVSSSDIISKKIFNA